jgi:tRNA (guanine10-N2)-dimethyltransferase
MTPYWFILGREPLLSAAEIAAVFNLNLQSLAYTSHFLKVTLPQFDAEAIVGQLGGTVKIARELCTVTSETDLHLHLLQELETLPNKITFGFSWYGASGEETRLLETWGKALKRDLKGAGRSVRYVYKREAVLSSVSVDKNDLQRSGCEFIIERKNNQFSVARTIAVQPFEALSSRDYGRPGRDSESGMLPPKLALMLVNLTQCVKGKTLLDPFCGSGTVLTEAMLAGYTSLIGTDLSEKAITDCNTNIAWHKEQFKVSGSSITTHVADVTALSSTIKTKVAAIATEPYMGPPQTGRESNAEIHKIASELEQLYLKAFKQFKQILSPSATVIFIIPRFERRSGYITISDKLIGKLEKLGFVAEHMLPTTIRREPFILYRRENQRVAREIWRFKLKTAN